MDRALKERITGAVVLVVIAVLVVPVFLDGAPNDARQVTQTVTLPGQEEQRRKQQTIVLERDRDQPVPVAGSRGEEAGGSPGSAPAVASAERSAPPAESEPEPQPQAQEREEPPPDRQEDADSAAREPPAREEDVEPAEPERQEPVRVAQSDDADANADAPPTVGESATGMWAVQLGSFSNADNAQRLASDLRTDGYAAFLSQLKTADGSLHRVRVGPQKDRESAEAVAKRLGGDGHDGQVVPHP